MLYATRMNERTLAQLIGDRIATAYGGQQAPFARAVGVSTQTVNNWVHGKVALPQVDARRRLARELGVRHVELFVLAGELEPDEIGPGAPPPFLPDDPRAAIMDDLRAISAEEAAYIRPIVAGAIRMAQRAQQPNTDPAPIRSG